MKIIESVEDHITELNGNYLHKYNKKDTIHIYTKSKITIILNSEENLKWKVCNELAKPKAQTHQKDEQKLSYS